MKVAIFLPKVLFWLEITKLEFKQKSIIGFKIFFLISIPLINEENFPLEFGMKSNFGIWFWINSQWVETLSQILQQENLLKE